MSPLRSQLKPLELEEIRYRLSIDEPRVIRRANILNCLHLGYVCGNIAKILNVDPKTVTNVGNAYLEGGLDSALYDEERSGRPIDFDDRERSRIVAMVCSKPPRGYYRWTLDLMVEEAQKRDLVSAQISRETVRVILKEHDLKPWQEKMWCIGELNEEYIRRMEDVLGVYARGYSEKRHAISSPCSGRSRLSAPRRRTHSRFRRAHIPRTTEMYCRSTWARIWQASCGTGLRFTRRLYTPAGSTRPKLRSGCIPGSV